MTKSIIPNPKTKILKFKFSNLKFEIHNLKIKIQNQISPLKTNKKGLNESKNYHQINNPICDLELNFDSTHSSLFCSTKQSFENQFPFCFRKRTTIEKRDGIVKYRGQERRA